MMAMSVTIGSTPTPVKLPDALKLRPQSTSSDMTQDSGYFTQYRTPVNTSQGSSQTSHEAAVRTTTQTPSLLSKKCSSHDLTEFDMAVDDTTISRFTFIQSQIEKPLLKYVHKNSEKFRAMAIRLMVLGTSEPEAKPYIVVLAPEEQSKRVRKFFDKTSVRSLCRPRDETLPSFEILIYRRPPERKEAEDNIDVLIPLVNGDLGFTADTFCGAPIIIRHPSGIDKRATLGGIVKVIDQHGESRLYGMTAGHVVGDLDDYVSIESDTGAILANDSLFLSDSDSDSDSGLEFDSYTDDLSESARGNIHDMILPNEPEKVSIHPDNSTAWSLLELGNLGVISKECFEARDTSGKRTTNIPAYFDWALIDMVQYKPNKLCLRVPAINGSSQSGSSTLGDLIMPASGSTYNGAGKSVFVISGSEGPKKGRISSLPSRLLLGPGREFVNALVVNLDAGKHIDNGDSGSWVVDEKTLEVYGHIVAADLFGGGYIMPLYETFQDIADRLHAKSVGIASQLDILAPEAANDVTLTAHDAEAENESVQHGSAALSIRAPADIDNLRAFAESMYRRVHMFSTMFHDIAIAVYRVWKLLGHLKSETDDPESLLNSHYAPVYSRQLAPIIEDCEFTLKQLDTIIENSISDSSGKDNEGLNTRRDDMLSLIRVKLENQTLNIDMFLDTVQLHNPSKSREITGVNNVDLDSIKDKVDAIAASITERKDSGVDVGDEELWLTFRDELEKVGFSRVVLRKNQDVLRAYIRQLDEQNMARGGQSHTIRGSLGEHPPNEDPPDVIPYLVPLVPEYKINQKGENDPSVSNDKFSQSAEMEQLRPEQNQPNPSSSQPKSTRITYQSNSSEDGDVDNVSYSIPARIISTRDLMALDKWEADQASSIRTYLTAPGRAYTRPNHIFDSNRPELFGSSSSPAVDEFELPPHFVPLIPPPLYTDSSPSTLASLSPPSTLISLSPSSTVYSDSISTPDVSGSGITQEVQNQARRYHRLAPDASGRDIPLDAQWTKVHRSLISPEVLNQTGVRYEARPNFIAMLGIFTKDDITELARRTAEIRKKRRAQHRRDIQSTRRYYPGKYKDLNMEENKHSGPKPNDINTEFSTSTDSADSTDFFDSDNEPNDELSRYRSHGGNSGSQDNDNSSAKVLADPINIFSPRKGRESEASPLDADKIYLNDVGNLAPERPVPRVFESDLRPTAPPRQRKFRNKKKHHDSANRNVEVSDDARDRADRDKRKGKYAGGESLKAVGIGGAAASLLSVLTEAAAGL